MAGIKISALTAVGSSQLTDLIPAVQSGVTVKETLSQVLTLFNSNAQLGSSAQVTGLDGQLALFVPLAGGIMSGPLLLNTNSPTTALQAASKGYVDTVASGFTVILAAQAATTANLNATPAGAGVGATLTNAGAMAAFAVDGYSASLNDRILVKNQTLTQHNGIYTVTTVGSGAVNWVLTRATDYDQPAEIQPGTLIAVNNGTVNANTSWLETATVVTVDTDPILFSQFTFAPSSFFLIANNLSEGTPATMRTNLGLGTVATKAASDAAKTNAVMLDAAPTIGHLAVFTDVNGTIGDGGLPSNITLNDIADGRLTLTSNVPVTTSDVLAASTVFYTPYIGSQIALYDGVSAWDTLNFTQLSIAVPGTTSTIYDFFVYNNLGTATPELQAWTNDTTRNIGLIRQDGVLVKSGDATRRYVGSFRTTTTLGQTEDSVARRFLWNYYNRVLRLMSRIDTTNTWNYSTASFRQANGSTANQLDMVIGVSEDTVYSQVVGEVSNSTGTGRIASNGIGLDSTTVNSAITNTSGVCTSGISGLNTSTYYGTIAAGRHTLVWLEKGAGVDTQIWSGDLGGAYIQTGITGFLRG